MTEVSLNEINLLHDNICKALSDPTRILIFYALHQEPRYVSQLAEVLDIPQSTISRHLTILRERRLVIPQRQGSAVIYHLADVRVIEVLDTMRALMRDIMERQIGSIE